MKTIAVVLFLLCSSVSALADESNGVVYKKEALKFLKLDEAVSFQRVWSEGSVGSIWSITYGKGRAAKLLAFDTKTKVTSVADLAKDQGDDTLDTTAEIDGAGDATHAVFVSKLSDGDTLSQVWTAFEKKTLRLKNLVSFSGSDLSWERTGQTITMNLSATEESAGWSVRAQVPLGPGCPAAALARFTIGQHAKDADAAIKKGLIAAHIRLNIEIGAGESYRLTTCHLRRR